MKNNVKRFGIAIISVLLFVSCQKTEIMEKTIQNHSASFPQLTIDGIVSLSEYIVHGIVVDKKDTIVSEYLGAGDQIRQEVFTPYEIEIIEDIKGNIEGDTIEYLAYGGETETEIHIFSNTGAVSIGDEVLVFLTDHGVSWGSQGVYIVEDDMISVQTHMLPTATLSEDTPNSIEMELSDYIAITKEAISNTTP